MIEFQFAKRQMKREIKLKLRSFLLKPYLLKALILVAFLIRSDQILSGVSPSNQRQKADSQISQRLPIYSHQKCHKCTTTAYYKWKEIKQSCVFFRALTPFSFGDENAKGVKPLMHVTSCPRVAK